MRTQKTIKKAAAAAQSTDELLRLLLEVMLDLREVFTAEANTEEKPAPIVEPPPVDPALLVAIEELPLSARTKGVLWRSNYKTLNQLTETSAKGLSSLANMGVVSINEIGALLEERGFKLTGYPYKK